jgi:Protein of unknown function (DUF1670)
MITPPDCYKKFNSARQRFLRATLVNFFERELPHLWGPTLREKLADEIVTLIAKVMPAKHHVKPGQIVWNALDVRTRGDSPNRRFVPVILTIINDEEANKLATGTKMNEIAQEAIARITREAFAQGGVLSMRDIGLLTWHKIQDISKLRKEYEEKHRTTVPHTGNLHDMGTCITHKNIIVRKAVLEKKDPVKVAAETNHSLQAVERYLKDFRRVETCYNKAKELDFISQATGMTKHLIKQYIKIIDEMKNNS